MNGTRAACAAVSAAMVPITAAAHAWATAWRGYEAVGGEFVMAVFVWMFAAAVAWVSGRWEE